MGLLRVERPRYRAWVRWGAGSVGRRQPLVERQRYHALVRWGAGIVGRRQPLRSVAWGSWLGFGAGWMVGDLR